MRPRFRPLLGDSAFWTLAGTAAVLRVAVAVSTCCVVAVLAARAVQHGPEGLWSGSPSSLPAAVAVIMTATGLLVGATTSVRILRATVAFRRRAAAGRADVPAALADASRRLRLTGHVTVVRDRRPFALTYGLLRPRVLVSSALPELLSPPELEAVLAHEREHVRSRDPLKAALARILAGRYFFLPLLRHLAERHTDGRELAADRRAVAAYGVPAVAGALLKVVDTPRWAAGAPASGMGAARLLDARIGQLETGGTWAPPRRLGALRLWASVSGAAVLAWALVGSAEFMAHVPATGCML